MRWMLAVLVLVGTLIVVGIGTIAIRDHTNTNRCKELYGSDSSWAGQDKCFITRPLTHGEK